MNIHLTNLNQAYNMFAFKVKLRTLLAQGSIDCYVNRNSSMSSDTHLSRTPLYDLHCELGGKMVPFAGYEMPVQYPAGIIQEHLHTRRAASLFDVSHMGQILVSGSDVTHRMETLIPVDLERLGEHRATYALLTNDQGGIQDDLIITRWTEKELFLVVNAGCKEQDFAYLSTHLAESCSLKMLEGQALLALQGPSSAQVINTLLPETAGLMFMHGCTAILGGVALYVTRSGYTGEDGFEISIPAEHADKIARQLLAFEQVQPAGLGARDSLRLEAGLCLYGHDINQQTTPVEALLQWSISPARRTGGVREGGYPGAEFIQAQMHQGSTVRKRVGFEIRGKIPVREGALIMTHEGVAVGEITSGGFSPSLKAPVAMGYLESEQANEGNELVAMVRNKPVELKVRAMPFVKQRYFRG